VTSNFRLERSHWVTDTASITSCAGHPFDPATMVYGDAAGRVVALSLRWGLDDRRMRSLPSTPSIER
jgi:hypothetical protein